VQDGEELVAELEKSIGTFVEPFAAMQRGMLVVVLVAITSTLLLVGVQRRREHGLLLALGITPGSLAQLTLTEVGLVGVVGAVLGTVAGLLTYVSMMFVSPILTGLAAPFRFDLLTPVVLTLIGLAFVLAGAALPAWRTTRIDPAVALRYE